MFRFRRGLIALASQTRIMDRSRRVEKRCRLLFVVILVLATGTRAVSFGTALSAARKAANPIQKTKPERTPPVPDAVGFREVAGRGLLVRTWVNGAGPFSFAIDTGAGATLLSTRVVNEGQVQITSNRRTSIAGMSGVPVSATAATISSLAIGDSENY